MEKNTENILFGMFSSDEVTELLSGEVKELEFAWQKKTQSQPLTAQKHLLNIPQKQKVPHHSSLSPRGSSPILPQNPPPTPASGGSSRSITPTLNQVGLNANAVPFIPTSLSRQLEGHVSSDGGEESGERRGGGGGKLKGGGRGWEVGGGVKTASCTPQQQTPISVQTVAVATPPLPSTAGLQLTDVTSSRLAEPAAAPSACSSTSDPLHSSTSTPPTSPASSQTSRLQSPPSRYHDSTRSLSQTESLPSHTLTTSSFPNLPTHTLTHPTTGTSTSCPLVTGSQESPSTPSHSSSHSSPGLPSTSHTLTPSQSHQSTPQHIVPPTKAKSWAAIVSRSGCGQQTIATPPPCVKEGEGKIEEGAGLGGVPTETVVCKGEGLVVSAGSEATAVAIIHAPTHLHSLGAQLKGISVDHSPVCIQPRGLINQGNWCYMHAPLQALISVPEIFHLLSSLNPDPPLSLQPSCTPITDTMIQFFRKFEAYHPPPSTPPPPQGKGGGKKKRLGKEGGKELVCGAPFRPDGVYALLHKIQTSLSTKGRQEDAEEFLCCVLDGLHEEMVSAQRITKEEEEEEEGGKRAGKEEGEGGEEWEQVGPKNKSTITRQTSFNESPISAVFGGELRSVLQRQGIKESATVEPFFSLKLDIQSEDVWSVQEAMEALATKETVQMNSGTAAEVDAHRKQTIAHLPTALILHLKRFIFDKTGGSQKLHKTVQYDLDLEVVKDLLAPAIRNKLSLSQRTYKLWGVVYHHGKSSVGGHYTCDVLHPSNGGWLRCDDSILKLVSEQTVLKQSTAANKVAYLLFYRRKDTISSV